MGTQGTIDDLEMPMLHGLNENKGWTFYNWSYTKNIAQSTISLFRNLFLHSTF